MKDGTKKRILWMFGVCVCAIIALCALVACDETTDVPTANCSLTYSASVGGSVTGETSQTVEFGNDGSAVTAVADELYEFVGWSDGVTTATRTDTNVKGNLSVTAKFEKQKIWVVYASEPGGHIVGAAEQYVEYGGSGRAVTAMPDAGYEFVGWSDGVTTATRRDENISGALSVTAQFKIKTFTVTYIAAVGGHISGNSLQTIEYGKDGSAVTAVADGLYEFVGWSDGVTTATRRDENISGALSVTAQFKIEKFTLQYTVTGGGHISGKRLQIVEYGNDGSAVTAVPDDGYKFVGWSDGVTTPTRTDTNVTNNKSVSAIFATEEVITFRITYSAAVGGSIDGEPEQIVVSGGNGMTVTAVPENGYDFVGWSDGVTTATRTDKNVTEDIAVTAQFEIKTFTVTYTATVGGRVTGETTQTVEYGKSGSAVTAEPDNGYEFVGWSDGVTTATRTDTNVTEDIDVQALFGKKNIFTFTLNESGTGYRVKARDRHLTVADIPSHYNGLPVTEIFDSGFMGCVDLTEVNIPDTVTRIGRNAFINCQDLTKVTGMNNVKEICQYAFMGCTVLENLILPSTLEVLGNEIIALGPQCVYIRLTEEEMNALNPEWNERRVDGALTIYIGDENLEKIGDKLIFSMWNDNTEYKVKARNKSVVSVVIPAYYNGLPVTEIADNGFGNCSDLVEIYIPETIKRLGSNTFAYCEALKNIRGMKGVTAFGSNVFAMCTALEDFILPAPLTEIGNSIFYNGPQCVYIRLTEEQINALNPKWNDHRVDGAMTVYIGDYELNDIDKYFTFGLINDGTAYSVIARNRLQDGPKIVIIPSYYNGLPVAEIKNNGFMGCLDITDVYIPETVTRIGKNAFIKCTSLVNVTGMKNVVEIDSGAFALCKSLEQITMKRVERIGPVSFGSCYELRSVIIPNTVIEIDDSAFSGDKNLTTVIGMENVKILGDSVFSSCVKLVNLILPSTLETLGQNILRSGPQCVYIRLTEEEMNALNPRWNNHRVNDAETVYVGDLDMSDADKYFTFGLTDDGTAYKVKANSQRSDLTIAIIPSYYNGLPVVEIMDNAFMTCSNLTEVYIPNTIERIGVNAFITCRSLTKVTGMNYVKEIGKAAFAECKVLENLILPSTLEVLGYDILAMGPLCVYIRLTEEQMNALNPEWNDHRVDGALTIYIGDNDISNINNYFTFVLTDDGTAYKVKVGASSDIVSAIIPSYYNGLPVVEIMDNAFMGCSDLTEVYIPDTVTRIGANAFMACGSLIIVDGMNGVVEIDKMAFSDCVNLDSIILPSTLETLGYDIFAEGVRCVYIRMTEEQMNALNPEWNDHRIDGATTVYIGDGTVPETV